MNLPQKIYSEKDLTRARSRAKVVGWVQGGGAVLAAGILWNLLGWIPVLIALGAVVWVVYKVVTRPGGEGEEGGP